MRKMALICNMETRDCASDLKHAHSRLVLIP